MRRNKPRNSGIVNLLNSEDVDTSTGQHDRVLSLDTASVSPRDQARTDFGDIESLANTIQSSGQDSPISVRKTIPSDNVSTDYIILAGERRWRACSLLGIRVRAIDKGSNDASNDVVIEAIENFQRKDLNPFETATLIQRLLAANKKKVEIAELLGRPKQFVSTHLKLVSPRQELVALYKDGITTDSEALSLIEDIFAIDEATGHSLANQARQDGVTRAHLRRTLKTIKEGSTDTTPDVNPSDRAPNKQLENNEPALKESSGSSNSPLGPGEADFKTTEVSASKGKANANDTDSLKTEIPHAEQKASMPEQHGSPDSNSGDVKVKVVVGVENAFMAQLVLKRPKPGMAWVELSNGTLQEVPVSDITIQSVD